MPGTSLPLRSTERARHLVSSDSTRSRATCTPRCSSLPRNSNRTSSGARVRDYPASARSCSRSHSTVAASPRAGPRAPPSRAAAAPSPPTASGAARRPRSSAGAPARTRRGPRRTPPRSIRGDLGDGQLLRRRDVEVLVLAGRVGHGRDDAVGDVVDVRERARLLAGAEDLQRPLAREHLPDQVGHHVRDARLVLGQLAGAVGVEGPADRERQAVLVVERAAVDLAGELREAVGRARASGSRARAPRWSGTRWRARTPSTRTRTRAAPRAARARRGRPRCRGRCSPRAACAGACGSWRCRRRSRPGGSRACSRRAAARASAGSRRSPVWTSQASRIQAGAVALVGHAHLPVRVADQPAHHRGADRAGAARDEDARRSPHGRGRAHRARTPAPLPVTFHGSTSSVRPAAGRRSRRRPSGSSRSPRRRRPRAPPRAAPSLAGTYGSCRATCASSRSSRRISLTESESRRSSESRLKVRPSTATLRSRSEPPSRA